LPAQLPIPKRLAKRHRVDNFTSGEPVIDQFLTEDARRHAQAGFSTTWVISDPEDKSVWGFISLSATSQPVIVAGRESKKRVLTNVAVLDTCPFPEVPALEIGYLGTRVDKRGQGIGKHLLRFALLRALKVSREVGVAAIVLDALTDSLLKFYSREFKFERLPYPESERRRMLLTIAEVRYAASTAWAQ
jgi:GNAT superfamily N-acetyltransferase